MSDPLTGPPAYVWWQDMNMLSASDSRAYVLDEAVPDNEGTGYKPRYDEPRWVFPTAVLVMLVVVVIAATVIFGAVSTN